MGILGTLASGAINLGTGAVNYALDPLGLTHGATNLPELGVSERAADPSVNIFGQPNWTAPASSAPGAQTPTPTNTPNITGTSQTAPSPYSTYQQGLMNNFDPQKANIFSSANDAATNAGQNLGYGNNGIMSFINGLRDSQQGIDNKGVQNELAKIQGGRSILDMVGRGIKSGGVMLGNRNAGDSSGAEAIARAYGDAGRRQMSQVGNQYALGQNDIAQQQTSLDRKRNDYVNGPGGYQLSKANIVSGIVDAARNSLAQLDAQMAQASLPQRIAIEQEKENIRTQVMGHLTQYDQLLADQNQQINPMSHDASQQKAFGLASAGAAPESAFNFSSQTPTQWQGTGPFASDLPIFTYGQKKQVA